MKWLVDGYILNVHFVYDALSDTLVFDGNSNSIGLTGDKSRACDVVKEKVFCGTEYVRDVTISNSEILKDNCEHCLRNDNFSFIFSKDVTVIKAIQVENFTSTLYSRWQKFEKIKPDENKSPKESVGAYCQYSKYYTSLVTAFGNFVMQNYIKVQGKKPLKDIESNINAWFAYIKKKYQIELNGRYDKSFDKIVDIEDFFRNLMFFCFEFKISGCINDGWNEELKFVDKGLSLR
mgnify:FL=1